MSNMVAFLQNQWFPAAHHKTIEYAYSKHGTTPEDRAELNARYLFYRCRTGKNIKAAFDEQLIERITWENCTRALGSEASSKLPPDPDHIEAVLRHFQPDTVVLFGQVAQWAVGNVIREKQFPVRLIVTAPHPAARFGDLFEQLRRAADTLRGAP